MLDCLSPNGEFLKCTEDDRALLIIKFNRCHSEEDRQHEPQAPYKATSRRLTFTIIICRQGLGSWARKKGNKKTRDHIFLLLKLQYRSLGSLNAQLSRPIRSAQEYVKSS